MINCCIIFYTNHCKPTFDLPCIRLFLGGHKRRRSLYPPPRILEVYIEALTGSIPMYRPYVSTPHYCLKVASWKPVPALRTWWVSLERLKWMHCQLMSEWRLEKRESWEKLVRTEISSVRCFSYSHSNFCWVSCPFPCTPKAAWHASNRALSTPFSVCLVYFASQIVSTLTLGQ